MENKYRLHVATYNLHGFNQGCEYLKVLCSSCDIIFTQEHWLAPFDLGSLNDVDSNMICFASSAMDKAISTDCLRGRPFGGLAVYVRNTLNNVKLICASQSYIIVQYEDILLVNVYLPCKATVQREEKFADCLASVMNDIVDISFSNIIFGGDMNIDFTGTDPLRDMLIDFTQSLGLVFVDDKLPCGQHYTFRVDSTGAESLIDHFAVTKGLYDYISDVEIMDSGINLSDHCPLKLEFVIPGSKRDGVKHESKNNKQQLTFRWDKGDVMQYFNLTYEMLSAISVPTCLLSDTSMCGSLSSSYVTNMVNTYCNSIVQALYRASILCIPRKQHAFFKYWWDEELNLLKDKAITSFKLWCALGKPRTGNEFQTMRHDKLIYKLTIRKKQTSSAEQFSDSLNDALMQKDMQAFWNTWRSKFGRKQTPSVIDNCYGDKNIADRFATVFQSVCVPNSAERHQQLYSAFQDRFASYCGHTVNSDLINVDLVQKGIENLKRGKAAGLDGITAEHIIHAHPILHVHLALLFRILYIHSIVPDDFGRGIVIPLLKNPDGNQFVSDNYRGITLSTVISKIFEIVLFAIFENQLTSDSLQFGFKQRSSCSHALFTLKTVVEHYVKHGSTVNICALDISKAFDRVDQYGLLQLLMDRQLPKNFIGVLHNWLAKCYACVRWGGSLSCWFYVSAGVRQGGVLSPVLFAIYMDVLIVRLKSSGLGCQLLGVYYGCLMYADDIMLLTHTVSAMRHLLKICDSYAVDYDIKFNSNKSVAMRIGPRYNAVCVPFELAGDNLRYVTSIKYLGVVFDASKHFRCLIDHVKMRFYRVFNCIFSKSKAANSEIVTVELLKRYCLPFVLYASEAVTMSSTSCRRLDNCINRAMYKIFAVSNNDNLWQLRHMFGIPSIQTMIESRRQKFFDRLLCDNRYTVVLSVNASNVF